MQFIQKYNPTILILVETHVPSCFVNSIFEKSYFIDFVESEAYNFARGVWILWDVLAVQVKTISVDDQIINLVVKRGRDHPWFLSAIYASPKSNFWSDLWTYLCRLGRGMSLP